MATRRSSRAGRFQDVVASWLVTKKSANTRAAYASDLSQFAAWCESTGRDVLRVAQADIAMYRDDCVASGTGSSTIARRLSALTSFYEHVKPHRANPAEGVGRPAKDLAPAPEIDPGEASALLQAADETGPGVAALVRLLMVDGLKLGEVLGADVGDYTTPPPELHLHGAATRQPAVRLSKGTAGALGRYVKGRAAGPLFVSENARARGGRMNRFAADHILKRTAARAGILSGISANTLRRRFVADAHASGAELEDIRASLGHADMRTTMRLLPHSAAPATNPSRK